MELDCKTQQELYEYMAQFITENKKSKFESIVEYRTRHLTVVLEDIYQPQNASAVLRTCDCFGIQDVHIIENRNTYNLCKDVELGSSQWLSLKTYNENPQNTLDAFKKLKAEGYRIVATTPHKNDKVLEDLSIDGKIALAFGTELNGLSEIAMEHADEFVKIPMYGFTESFNISVSAAISLSNISERIRRSSIPWGLTDKEKIEVRLNWARSAVRNHAALEAKFFEEKS
jgi:tRNA (guanosine-2'-O-)-methyltransferase